VARFFPFYQPPLDFFGPNDLPSFWGAGQAPFPSFSSVKTGNGVRYESFRRMLAFFFCIVLDFRPPDLLFHFSRRSSGAPSSAVQNAASDFFFPIFLMRVTTLDLGWKKFPLVEPLFLLLSFFRSGLCPPLCSEGLPIMGFWHL